MTVQDVVSLAFWGGVVVAIFGAGFLIGWLAWRRPRPGLVVVGVGTGALLLIAVVGTVVVRQASRGDEDWAGFLEFLIVLALACFAAAVTWFGVGMATGGALRRRRDAQRGFSPPPSRSQT